MAWLQDAEVFKTVLPFSSALDAPYTLEGLVTELYGDFRDRHRPMAVFAIQFYLSRTAGAFGPVVFSQTWRHIETLPDRAPASVVRGLHTALERVLPISATDYAR